MPILPGIKIESSFVIGWLSSRKKAALYGKLHKKESSITGIDIAWRDAKPHLQTKASASHELT